MTRVGVITFPGTLDDIDAARAVRLAGGEAVSLWHSDADLKGVDAVVVPGGFSYGDYLRCGAIARFAGIDNRTAAEKLRGTTLSVSRNDLPPLEDGEFYHSDLIGLAVVTDSGEPVGEVRAIENSGATDIVEIEKPDGKSFMIPLTEQAVPEWSAERLVMSADFLD